MGKLKLFLQGQILHYSLLLLVSAGLRVIVQNEGFLTGEFLGIGTSVWFWLTIAAAITHQTYVWLCWRLELYYSLITRIFKKNGFQYYCVGFFVLLLSRLAAIFILALSNSGSLHFNRLLLYMVAGIFTIPAAYTLYSTFKYFGFRRAAGIDHFDTVYRSKPHVKEGVFKFFKNPMYTFGLLAFWLPGLLLSSKAALLAALFNHLYAWIHYYCTEKPDMRVIYSGIDS